jgi:hypothetical protein
MSLAAIASLFPLSTFLPILFLTWTILLLAYVIYQRYFHPLSKFPGPLTASLTNFWKFYHHARIELPQTIQALHEEYGPVVRIGPNDLDFNGAGAVGPIYKAGRRMPKSQFYDAFTAIRPNIFGTRDEAVRKLSQSNALLIKSRSSTPSEGARSRTLSPSPP